MRHCDARSGFFILDFAIAELACKNRENREQRSAAVGRASLNSRGSRLTESRHENHCSIVGVTAGALLGSSLPCGNGQGRRGAAVSGPNADLGNQVDKAFDLYVKLHAKDLGDNKIEIIKRDEGPPSGASARTVATELITNDKVKLVTGFVFSPSAIALAPLVPKPRCRW